MSIKKNNSDFVAPESLRNRNENQNSQTIEFNLQPFLAFFSKNLAISIEISQSVIDQFKCFFSTRDRSVWSQIK